MLCFGWYFAGWSSCLLAEAAVSIGSCRLSSNHVVRHFPAGHVIGLAAAYSICGGRRGLASGPLGAWVIRGVHSAKLGWDGWCLQQAGLLLCLMAKTSWQGGTRLVRARAYIKMTQPCFVTYTMFFIDFFVLNSNPMSASLESSRIFVGLYSRSKVNAKVKYNEARNKCNTSFSCDFDWVIHFWNYFDYSRSSSRSKG